MCIHERMVVIALLRAFITRVLFCLHVLLSVGLVVLRSKQPLYWVFLVGLVFMISEMVHVMVSRKGVEYKYFWPSCFLYLSSIIPVIWVMELDLLQHRLDKRDQLTVRLGESSTTLQSGLNIGGIGITASIDGNTAAKKVCELGVVLLIILGRWLLPRGQMTRDQLSNLLLGYVGMGADILELFSALTEREVMHDVTITYVTLVLFSWSMLQFCIVATATAGSEDDDKQVDSKEDVELGECGERSAHHEKGATTTDDDTSSRYTDVEVIPFHDSKENTQKYLSVDDPRSSIAEMTVTESDPNISDITPPKYDLLAKQLCKCKFVISADLFQIVAALFMQDGPFFLLRMVLIISYGVSSEVHIFFTAKNALTVALMLYRLYSLVLGAIHFPHVKIGLRRNVQVVKF